MNPISESEFDKLSFEKMILERWRIIRNELEFIGRHHGVVERTFEVQIEIVNSNLWRDVEAAGDPDLEQDVVEEYGSECYDCEHT